MKTMLGLAAAACVLAFARSDGAEADRSAQMVVRDGQLRSHPFMVFVTHEISPGSDPRLTLRSSYLIGAEAGRDAFVVRPLHVIPDQTRVVDVEGVASSMRGTVLLFDLRSLRIPFYKSAARVLPLLEWTESGAGGGAAVLRQAVATREVFIGNMIGAAAWTVVVMGSVLAALLAWSNRKSQRITGFTPRPMLLLVTGPDGYLSLWRTQLMLWTFAVGGLVFSFGLLRLRVPELPESLVALMGLSLVTGGLSAVEARKQAVDDKTREGLEGAGRGEPAKPPAKAQPEVPPAKAKDAAPPGSGQVNAGEARPPDRPRVKARGELADLVCGWNDITRQPEMSVPKAQMVVWTVVILLLFLVKSVLEGELWEVPWELVALTGVSQAGYVSDKVTKRKVRLPAGAGGRSPARPAGADAEEAGTAQGS